ncbi:MAG TPA: hypothetical protein VF610_13330, partial [Segetibacter sp.]
MKLYKLLTGILVISCFASCLRKNPANLWFYTHSIDSNANDTLLTPSTFLNLERDGTYTREFGTFDYGTWKYKDDALLLTNAANTTTTLPLKHVDAEELQLVTGKGVTANFDAQTYQSKGANNPFSLANNRWRIRATHKETEQELKNRLINHCQFWASYFTWAFENKLANVDVRSTPTLIKIYGNGFGLKPYEELPAAWRSYFFDAEDCKIANNLMYEVFQYANISWAH